MPRYEFSEGSSNKFWEITLKDNAVVTHYGRIGAEGQATTKSFKNAAEAKSAYDKLIAEKSKKGYVLKGGTAAPPSAEKTPAASAPSAENPLITRLDAWLKKNRPQYYAKLKPGAGAAEIEKLEKQVGALPQTLKDLLRWRNGQSVSSRLIDNWSLMSVKQIASAWETMKELKEAGDLEKNSWDVAWVPFLENGSGDNLCINLKKKGAVLEFWHADDDRDVVYSSIDKMLEEFLKWIEKGHWGIDDSGLVNWGKDIDPSDGHDEEAEDDEEDDDSEEKEAEAPGAPMGKREPNIITKRLLQLPEKSGYRSFSPDVSPDGKHVVYNFSDKRNHERFILDGKESPWFELLLGPWFDAGTGIMVYKEGAPRKMRWHIGDQVHDVYELTGNPQFSADGKHHCYDAKKGKKSFIVVDGVPQKDIYDRVYDPVWSPDGKKIAFIGEIGEKRFVVNNGERGPDCIEPRDLVFSPDSSKLAYCITTAKSSNKYQIWCGEYKSAMLGLATQPGFTPTGELWYPFTIAYPNHGYGLCIGEKIIMTKRSVETAFFLENGHLAAHVESDGRRSFLVRPGKPDEDLPNFCEGLFFPPNTIAIVADRMTQQQAMVSLQSRQVLCVNGKETEEYDRIQNPRFSAGGKSILFGAQKGRDVLRVEMPV